MLLHRLRPADAVGHADAAQAVEPGVGVGGEPGVVLAGHPDQLDRALLDHLVERQHVVAGDAEDVLDPQRVQPVDQVLADGRHGRIGGLRRGSRPGRERWPSVVSLAGRSKSSRRADPGRAARGRPSGSSGPRASGGKRPGVDVDPDQPSRFGRRRDAAIETLVHPFIRIEPLRSVRRGRPAGRTPRPSPPSASSQSTSAGYGPEVVEPPAHRVGDPAVAGRRRRARRRQRPVGEQERRHHPMPLRWDHSRPAENHPSPPHLF